MSRLIQAIQRTLHPLWNARVPEMISKADTVENKDPREVYVQVYKEAYFAAIDDMIKAGLLSYPKMVPETTWEEVFSSEVIH